MSLYSFFMEKTNGCISLKHISDLTDEYSEIEAIKIEKQKLDEAIFIRPNIPIVNVNDIKD